MARTNTYPFDDPNNYTYFPQYMEFSGGRAQFKLTDDPGLFNQPFDSDSGFTYDSAKAEFSGGQVQQIDKQPGNSRAGANFNTDIDLEDWSAGVVTGTATGGATVASGKLDLGHNDLRYVKYAGLGNFDSQQTGTIKFKMTPKYSGAPSTEMRPFTICTSPYSNARNYLAIRHLVSGGNIQVMIANSAGAWINLVTQPPWLPVADQEYEFCLCWDLDAGVSTLYIDKTRHGSEMTGTGTRSSDIQALFIGVDHNLSKTSNFLIDDFIYYNTSLHSGASYTDDYSVPTYKYEASKVELPVMTYAGHGSIQSFDDFQTSESNSPHYVVNDLYYNGGWISSDGTYGQSNTAAEVLANLSTLPLADTVNIDIIFNDGQSQMLVSDLTLDYTGQEYLDGDTYICVSDAIHATEIVGVTMDSSDNVRVAFGLNNGVDKVYWNGSAWVTSNCSYDQSNDIADLTEAVLSQLISSNDMVKWGVVFRGDGDTQEWISNFTISYNYYPGTGSLPTGVTVYGTEYGPDGNVLAGCVITAKLTYPSYYNEESGVQMITVSATADTNGYWTMELLKNEDILPAGTKYFFEKTYNSTVIEKAYKTVETDGSEVNYFSLT